MADTRFSMKLVTEQKCQIIREAMNEADKGEFISEETMKKWFLSLGTDDELAEPKPDTFINQA